MSKKLIRIAVPALVLAAALIVIGLRLQYPIALNQVTLPRMLERNHRLPEGSVTLYDAVEIGSRYYQLLEADGQLGCVTLERGPNGRYRQVRLTYGDGNFLNGIVTHRGQQYLLLAGRDVSERIARLTVELDGLLYEPTLPKAGSRRFLTCTPIAPTEEAHIDLSGLTLYDATGTNITADYDRSGGGIF